MKLRLRFGMYVVLIFSDKLNYILTDAQTFGSKLASNCAFGVDSNAFSGWVVKESGKDCQISACKGKYCSCPFFCTLPGVYG